MFGNDRVHFGLLGTEEHDGHLGAEARGAAKHPVMHRAAPETKSFSIPHVSSAQAEKT